MAPMVKPPLHTAKQRLRPDRKGARVGGLLPKQIKFIDEYLVSANATQAALRAGYSPKTAHVIGQNNLKKVAIAALLAEKQKEIDDRQAVRLQAMELTNARVEKEIARISFFDARKMFNKAGEPLPITELDDDTAACIVGIEVLEQWEGVGTERRLVGQIKKYKIADKNAALDKAAKILGMYEADNKQTKAVTRVVIVPAKDAA